jgi:phenylalanyl-tRNA synthetase beta chain
MLANAALGQIGMKFSYNLICKYVDTKLTPEKLAEILSTKTAEVEQIDKVGGDSIMEIKILYSRGDLLSHYGLAREIAILTGGGLKSLDLDYKETNEKTSGLIKVAVENSELCPRYTAQVIKNVKIGDSPKWLKEVLAGLGLKPINNIVDITNYVMLEMGQPLHAFDYDKLATSDKRQATRQIIVRNAKKGEKIKVLDEAQTEYELDENTLLITDQEKPLAIAGIKGGYGSEITDSTRTIVLESANFDRTNIRKTSTKLGLRTDASVRFSYGLDPNLAGYAIYRATKLIQELADGEATKGNVTIYPREIKPWKIPVKKSYINSLIGAAIPEMKINKILSRICQAVKSDSNKFVVTVPTYRLDLQTPEDIIEEIARIYGYENIKPVPPTMDIYRPAEERPSEDWDTEQTIKARNLMKDILKGLGFAECYNYSFLGEKTKEIFNIHDAPEIANPVSQEAKYLRPGLIPNLILAADRNLRFYNSVRLFETGNVFTQKGDEVEEKETIAGVIVGRNAFIELKGVTESFFRQLGIDDAEFSDVVNPSHPRYWYHPGRVAEVQIGEQTIGLIGDLHPHIKNELGIRPDLEAAQFSLAVAPLVKAMEEELEFEPVPKYPSVIRDISILVDRDMRTSQILNCIEDADTSRIVQDVDVFDIYEDNPDVPEGKKSVAFHIIYRSDSRTLTDTEVEKVEQNIKKVLEQDLGAEIR